MDLRGDCTLAIGYDSPSQRVRKISESWIATNGYCLSCHSDRLRSTRANTKSQDFACEECDHPYELKSKCGSFSTKVLDGAYNAMLRTIREGRTPTFLLLEYSTSWRIERLTAIHHSLITETSIQPRKPLAPSARRAGWVGCNIVLPAIAIEARIPVIQNGIFLPKSSSRDAFARLEKLAPLSASKRGWAGTVLNMLHRLPAPTFSLNDVYRFEPELQSLFPKNNHIRPKIRQQLQVLRDTGFLTFLGDGLYEFAG